MSPQDILRIAGIAALVVSVLFVILAIHYYATNHIGAVMDDLSGKARARGVLDMAGRAASDSRRGPRGQRGGGAKAPVPSVTKGTVAEAASPAFPDVAPAAAPAFDDEDGMDTVVVDVDFGAAASGAGLSDTGAAGEPTTGGKAAAGGTFFRLTRSIVLCDSDKIIASGERTSQ